MGVSQGLLLLLSFSGVGTIQHNYYYLAVYQQPQYSPLAFRHSRSLFTANTE